MRARTTKHLAGLALTAALCARAAPAHAQASAPSQATVARADALFEEGKRLRGEGDIAAACAKFGESKRLAPGVGITLHLADCYERLGHAASAWVEYREAEQLARDRGDARVEVAGRRARALEPKLGRVMGALSQVAKVLRVRILEDPPAAAQVTPPANEPTAPAPPVPAAPTPSPPPAESKAIAAVVPPLTPAPQPRDPGATRRWVSLGLAGLGVASAGVGAGFLAIKNQSMTTGAPGGAPQQDGGAATASAIAFATAGAAFASAVVLYLTAPPSKDVALHITPAPVSGGAGAFVTSTF
jgi:hypothetical protein